MKRSLGLLTTLFILATSSVHAGEVVVGFEGLTLNPSSFYNGDPGGTDDYYPIGYDGSFTTQSVDFSNTFYRGFGATWWNGWSYSNTTDTTTPGFTNQFSAITGTGAGGSQNYGVSYSDGNAVTIGEDLSFQSIDITNTTYAALSMRDGDGFAKKFGGTLGSDPDFFKLTITGVKSGPPGDPGTPVGTVDFYLADFRFDDDTFDYIVEDWTTVDLASLAGADTLTFSYESSDEGQFGINTPLYFAADNLVLTSTLITVPEPSTLVSAFICAFVALAGYGVTRRSAR